VDNVKIKLIHPKAKMPTKATDGSYCWDLYYAGEASRTVHPYYVEIFDTGLQMEIPPGHEVQIRARSGLAAKHGIAVVNSPGCIDSDFRDTVKVILCKVGAGPKEGDQESIIISPGDRIAQMCVVKAPDVGIELTTETLSETSRGSGGFGSSGK
jgi:dUTP pyrophosphatase